MLARRSSARYVTFCALVIVVLYLYLPHSNDPSIMHLIDDDDAAENDELDQLERLKNQWHQAQPKPRSGLHVQDGSMPLAFDPDRVRQAHYDALFDIFEAAWPNVTLGAYKNGTFAPNKAHDQKFPILTNEFLAGFLQVSPEEVARLKKGHDIAVSRLPRSYPSGLYKGKGVVTLAGGRYMPVLLTTIRMLRKRSPDIPIEVFVADEKEFEPALCETVFPKLNAKCINLREKVGEEIWERHNIHSYQLKVLALLMSSFEDVLLLDADSIPIGDVSHLFTEEPYASFGYVFWPDYWYRTTSPHFYEIAGRKLGPRVRGNLSETNPEMIPQADRQGAIPDKSTESGQVMVSKRKHYKSLLLATYYNLNGFDAYYKLLSQGTGGEGDKDTFIAAAEMLNEKYYQVKQDTRPAGYFDNGFHGTGMLQADPTEDYKLNYLNEKTNEEHRPKVQFMHLNVPKPNPRELIFGNWEQFTVDSKRLRYYGKPSENTHVFGFQDIELQMWTELQWSACELALEQGIVLKDWMDTGMSVLCKKIKEQVAYLERTSDIY
ncbi:alpha-1,2-mannosyltransferase Mnn2p [Trichomonascus vanleenenianus]|uniref:alpha-mannosyltransferase n=1 Tax=Trichomonascus vanleenenianus TaxID=2268995 RepID=UPI003ECB6CEB